MDVDDLREGDIVEFRHPETGNSESGTYGVARFSRTIQRRGGSKRIDIELVNCLGDKTTILPINIRWERTEYQNMR